MSYYFVEGRRGKTHLCISEEKPKTTESKQMCCGAQTRPRNITEYAGQEIT